MIVIDTETTGLDPDKHSIVSIGAVELEQPENQFYDECRMRENAEIMPKALEINEFSEAEIKDESKQPPQALLKNFLAWFTRCEGLTIAGHSVHKDLNFLNTAAKRFNLDCPDNGRFDCFHDRVVDTHPLVWMDMVQAGKEPPKDGKFSYISSDFVFDYVGIDFKRDDHNALEDAKLTAEAISRLLYDEKLFAEFS